MKKSRRTILFPAALTFVLVGGALCGAGPAVAAPLVAAPAQKAAVTDTSPTEKVVVILADQLTATPADRGHVARRSAAAQGEQASVLSRLAGPAPSNVKHFTVGNAFSASVTQNQAAALAADPAVASVSQDSLVKLNPTSTGGSSGTAVTPKSRTISPHAAAGVATVPVAVCSTDPKKPLLEPEALQTMNVRSDDPRAKTAAALGIDGSGVKVAFIADGIDPDNAGFRRTDGSSAIVDYQDFYGDGPAAPSSGAEAFGDASSIAAQGNVVYDLATFANPAVVKFPGNGHCYARIVGVSPGASVVALKAGAEILPNSAILQAIDYAVSTDHVDVLNESFGGDPIPDAGARNAIQVFDEQAVAAGVTVTVSSGDAGITNTIGNPSNSSKVISAGATTLGRSYVQNGYAFADTFGNGTWHSNNISALSSGGITDFGRTIDVSAPGDSGWAVCDDSGNFNGCTSFAGNYSSFQWFGGTSEAAPLTAGVAALVIQAFRKTHGGASPTPAVVKQLITGTARDLGFAGEDQGAGLVDARAAVEAALTYPGGSAAPAGVSDNVTASPDQLTLMGAPGSNRTGSVTVTNVGAHAVTVLPATRTYATVASSTQHAQLSMTGDTGPNPASGAPVALQRITFDVPAGVDVLDYSLYWANGAGPGQFGARVRVDVFNPDGGYEANTLPQGSPNYGTVLVRHPKAGTWSAVIYTPLSAAGFFGSITAVATSLRAVPVGSVTPARFTLAPGASRAVRVTVPVPASGGDTSYTLSLASSAGHQTAVPVIARALVPLASGTGHFTGTITGGNGRAPFPDQKFPYSFDVPAGQRDLDAQVDLGTAGDVLFGALIDPNGEVQSLETTLDSTSSSTSSELRNVVAHPQAGRWHYVVGVADPVTGTELSRTFQGTLTLNQQRVTSTLPSGGTIRAGSSRTATVTVTNPGNAPVTVQSDARSNWVRQVQLAPQLGSANLDLPLTVDDLSSLPYYLVPPDTNTLALSSASTVPSQVELTSPAFGIDVIGDLQQAKAGSTISTATVTEPPGHQLGQGLWSAAFVQEVGPYGDGGAATGSTALTAVATLRAFDSAVTSSTGDPYLASVASPSAGTPLTIAAHGSARITVTIKPTVRKGTTAYGILNVVTAPAVYGQFFQTAAFTTSGDVLATIPYSYTVN